MTIEVMKLALNFLEDGMPADMWGMDENGYQNAIAALRQAIQEAALQQLTDIHQEMEQKPVAWWNPDESGLSFQKLRGDWHPLYAAPVHAIDINKKCVDETGKNKHEPEPVGWFTEDYETDKSATTYNAETAKRWIDKGWPVTPLYTTPPKREWQGLTDEEIYAVIRSLCADNETAEMLIHVSMDEYRAIEAKLKEKNRG